MWPSTLQYAGAAGAILQLTRCAALDAAAAGVRVNAVCPGPIMTPGTQAHAESQGKTLEDTVAEMTQQLIIKRHGFHVIEIMYFHTDLHMKRMPVHDVRGYDRL